MDEQSIVRVLGPAIGDVIRTRSIEMGGNVYFTCFVL